MSSPGHRRTYWEQLGDPQTAVSLAVLYAAVMFLLRLLLSPNLNLAEAEQMLLGQSLQWGYRAGEPPLANWLSWAVLNISDGSKLALFLLREVIVALGLIAFFFAARTVLEDTRRGALAMFFLAASWGMGWLVHLESYNTTLLATMCCVYLWANTRALTRQATTDYLLLGLVTGLGVLSSYVFPILPFAMAVGLALVPELRKRLRLSPLLPAAIIALVIAAPSFFLASDSAGRMQAAQLHALRDLVIALVAFALPAAIIYPLLFGRGAFASGAASPWLRVLRYALAAGAVSAAALALLFSGVDAKALAFPVLLPLPLYIFLRTQLTGADTERNDRRFALAALGCVAIAVAARAVVYETGAARCIHCREYWPLSRYADTFRQAGFYEGTIAAPDPGLGGNLRLVFPEDRVVTPDAPALRFGPPVPGECLVVWPGQGTIPVRLKAYVESTYGTKLQDRAIQGDVEAKLLTRNGHLSRMNFVILARGSCDHPRG